MPEPRELAALPKGHLHLHLEAAIRQATIDELAAELGEEPVTVSTYEDFSDFIVAYRQIVKFLTAPANLERVIGEIIADNAADGAIYVELSARPLFYAESYGSLEAALEAILRFTAAAAEAAGITARVILSLDRTLPIPQIVEEARLAAKFAGRGVVGIGLASEERGYPVAQYAEAFDIARAAGLFVAPHAGELVGPSEVRDAIELCQADRVLHGVRAIEDPALVTEIAARGISLDVCPTSNVLLGVFPSYAEHPLPRLLDAGIRCSINADDPVLFGAGLLSEYEVARRELGLSDEQLAACALTSVECSGAPDEVKAQARAGVAEWLAA